MAGEGGDELHVMCNDYLGYFEWKSIKANGKKRSSRENTIGVNVRKWKDHFHTHTR